MSLSAKHWMFGAALVLSGSPLLAKETAATSGVAASPRAYVNCPGISNVPMTSDAEQALPMRQIATLSCGQPVAILADNEGYTAHIRTSDGKEGYVARMYLTTATPAAQPASIRDTPASSASPVDGIVRWNAGAPGCDQFISRGRKVESATANGITVQVSLQDTGWKLHASIAVSNASGAQVYVHPALITLDELTPTLRNLREENPAKLAHSEVNHQLMRSEYVAVPPPSAIVLRSRSAAKVAAVSDHSTSVGDYLVLSDETASVRAAALKAANLAPGQKTSGELWYARDANAYELSLRISVGDLVFDFPFSFENK
ncbi:MAG TPA: hypothetical protein VNO13_04640 [Candidatus Udaeobacter sp.]|nr:hypothetical protein [Candidatus Udaeobacter sp.]